MEELIPIAFFILWFLLGGIGSKKKREEAARRAEAQRAAREAAARARAAQRRATRESREADGRLTYGDSGEGGFFAESTSSSSSSSSETGSALDMVPDELWSILTGGAPRPTGPSRMPGESAPPARREPDQPGGWVTSPPWDEEAAVHSIEGVSREVGEDLVDYDDQAEAIARARYEGLRRPSFDDMAGAHEAEAVRRSETSDARHVAFHDALRATEIGSGAALRRRSGARDRLGLEDPGDVRRAIVLAEVLGPPKSLQW